MELFVRATLYNPEEERKPIYFIRKYSKFNINCLICSYATGIAGEKGAFGTYNLCLQGRPEDVIDFVVYLQVNGFKVDNNRRPK